MKLYLFAQVQDVSTLLSQNSVHLSVIRDDNLRVHVRLRGRDTELN